MVRSNALGRLLIAGALLLVPAIAQAQEVFNLFNRANYGSWVENESNARFGQPSDNNNIAFKPRLLQLGFRAAF